MAACNKVFKRSSLSSGPSRESLWYTAFMPQIRFRKNRPPLEVPPGSNLMNALLEGGLPVASSCRGDGICAKCRIEIVEGRENLSPENERERFLRDRHDIPRPERISCQVQVHGDITVDTSYW